MHDKSVALDSEKVKKHNHMMGIREIGTLEQFHPAHYTITTTTATSIANIPSTNTNANASTDTSTTLTASTVTDTKPVDTA